MTTGEKKTATVETMQLDCNSIAKEIQSIKNREKTLQYLLMPK